MKNKLEQITNLTINDLLNNKIILPSSYFEKFTYHAKELEVNLDDENFTKELNQLLIDDFNTMEKYMKIIIASAITLQENTQDSQNAILNKDNESLKDIYKKMINLENEIKSLTDELFIDELTKTYNRKWIYNKFLSENSNFKEDGICVLLNIVDFCYIQKEYGELLAKNLLLFVTKFISSKLKDEAYEFQIARYLESKFFIFISNENKKEVLNKILNIEQLLSNATLKSNAGLIIKAKYAFKISLYKKDEESKTIFETLLEDQEKKE
ncbi:diguanylate cyclase [bacterium]|jgi:GGDEF domain-containing protein|nr:diguanylate cyclase [bacterium]